MYERFEKYTVNPIPGKGYEVLGHFKDDVHDINSRILFDYRSYRVIEAEVHTSNLPFPICQSGLDKIKDIIGVPAGPGFNRTVKERLGGSSGCIHLAEMVMNAGRLTGSFLGTLTGWRTNITRLNGLPGNRSLKELHLLFTA